MLNKFKKLVDDVDITSFTEEDFIKENNINIKEEYSINIENTLSLNIKNQIKNLNSTEGIIDKGTFNKLSEELIYREIILNEDSLFYLSIIKIIIDGTASSEKFPTFDNEDWKILIKYCKTYLNFKKDFIDKDYLKTYHIQEFNRAQSIKYLKDKGCKIKIKDNNIEFIKEEVNEILIQLETKIKKFGGINLILVLFHSMNYDSRFKRFIFTKKTDIINQNKKLEIPYGYLFNLALKHPKLKYNTKKLKYEKLFKEIIKLSSIIINAVYDVQEYNIFNHVFQNERTIASHVSNLVLYDSLFRIPQGNINLELKLCKCFFSFNGNFFEKTLGFSLNDFLLVMKDLNDISLDNKNGYLLTLSKKEKYNLPYKEYHKILNFMSHNKINDGYICPNDYSRIDFFKKPLIKLDNNHFFIPSTSIMSPNFYEVLADNLRKHYQQEFGKELDELLGKKLELLIKSLFNDHNINYISNSKYFNEEYEGEADFIIETDNSIIIIEVKKKTLRRESKSGHAYRIFMDLFASFVRSQFQANKLEYSLKKFGEVELELEDGSKYKLLNKRYIKRISLTQLEYGSLYNHYFLENFLRILLNNEFTLKGANKKTNKKFKELKKDVEDYKNSYIKLDEISHDNYYKEHSFLTYFMSLSQLFEVIKRSQDNNSFCDNLPPQFIETGTFDWFFEYGIHLDFYNK